MRVSASKLRADIYRLLDKVLETGEPLVIERNGRELRIVCDPPRSRLDLIVPNPDVVNGDADDLASIDWSDEWKPLL
ncbi:MAG: type II toxin-antitoxin system Phd/YefM family antitoxin [Myxococcales bacterium]|nr:type II toxin-antitoxin system Phd/YefM family antitoxin [Myxococcales bacterium]MCB9537681.1 type II toxin-antitoxin system Phd/YefM family antitoxin [Myxococcales bacterium]